MEESVRKAPDWGCLDAVDDDELGGEDRSAPRETFLLRDIDAAVPRKRTVTIRLDDDVVDWFKQQGKGYQTRINKILRGYMRAHLSKDGV